MNKTPKPKKRRLVLILTLLFMLFPVAFFITNSHELIPSFFKISQASPSSTHQVETHFHTPSPSTPTHATDQAEEAKAALSTVSTTHDDSAILSMADGNHFHLFSYSPATFSTIRITNGDWDDITPALSPDGTKLAFSSNRDGFWDIFVWDLVENQLTKLTDTPGYDAFPTWSPDEQWIVFESYLDDNLELQIISTQPGENTPLRLTEHTGADHSPVWSPEGRSILFVSNRSGDEEIWLADLDSSDERFINISNLPEAQDRDPTWSPAGDQVAWSSIEDGVEQIVIYFTGSNIRKTIINGTKPVFSPNGTILLAINRSPDSELITIFSSESGQIIYPPKTLPGTIHGVSWKNSAALQQWLETNPSFHVEYQPPDELEIDNDLQSGTGQGHSVNPLEGISAPSAYLLDTVVQPFFSLRQQVSQEIGWNFLDFLENAYMPLTEPPSPGMQQSWLYTGRAIAINPMPLYGGWMCVMREDFSGQTYWRVYLKTRFQDGSQGMPLRSPIWNFNARYSGNPQSYEDGGAISNIPTGYWIDFTEIARRYGWKRLPALTNWRTYFSAALFNQYIFNDNLDWNAAMQQLYPIEALATATRFPTKTQTPTVTQTSTSTSRPTPTLTPTSTAKPSPSATK